MIGNAPGSLGERYLSVAEREEISRGLSGGLSYREIARQLGRAPSTISREVTNNGGRGGYRAHRAESAARDRARRPKTAKLAEAGNRELRDHVQARLLQEWSPGQITARLAMEFPDRPEMRVSHETIYQSLYVQSRGALRRELTACLRTGRALRRPRKQAQARRSRIPDLVEISERPAEAEDRAVPGHWEGDLITGAGNKSAIGTLVERSTRFVILLHLPHGHDAIQVRDAMIDAIQTLPHQLRRSLTWDRGNEMARHADITLATDLAIYFCDPHSPWQRGTNENTNGLLRQYFPKGTNLHQHTAEHLTAVAARLNSRPRKTLDWHTPLEKLTTLLS
ncbi:IS30 family transposase [Amycolatopsis roodepoortensis]|uniref:IS30 family transposase n=1 Tax=Amycolatopsis roodepoortensis TaxID=700274 RepID=A0ABR9L2J9_9PSEU|nr:IS30 family transposase [Amycolatopsis roodepoortensis]MBE1573938.1 IS30 family transposase [Amycolatopsis roodepoortensis]MBE1574450.1 IS30 family transposase [Amycolatopsis roodepoortensis]MBE1577968.1 IS30 family transposase [Amycolatopsis roodepoortensis]MBE1579374.1 IS30 family transposase [Amycolatopsis roodepoortensis]